MTKNKIDDGAAARAELEAAYGLLWILEVDTRTRTGFGVSTARKMILEHLDKDAQRRGIEFAKIVMNERAKTLEKTADCPLSMEQLKSMLSARSSGGNADE